MEKTRKPLVGLRLRNAVLIVATMLSSLVFEARVSAQAMNHSDPVIFSESSLPTIESKDGISLPMGQWLLSSLAVKAVLRNFLETVPDYLEGLAGDQNEEYEALYQTIVPFLESAQFDHVIRQARRNHDPVELTLLSPKPLKDSRMIHDFSQHFKPYLQYETSHEIVPTTVSIALGNPMGNIMIKVERLQGETVYVLDASRGSSFKRYQRPLKT